MDLDFVEQKPQTSHSLRQAELAVLRELVRQRTALVNQVRGLLHGWGLPPTGYFTHGGSWVHLSGKRSIPGYVRALLRMMQAVYERLSQAIREVETALRQCANQNEGIARLTTLPGVGELGALTLVAAVDHIERFDRAKQLTSHCAIAPTGEASGEREEQGPITHQGRSGVRAMLIQAAHALVRSLQPNAQPLQRWFSRVTHRRGLRTAPAAVPVAILSALVFCPAVIGTLTSISETPKNQDISTGQTLQYTAIGTYSDTSTNNITDQVTWSSSSTSVATINSSGLVTAVAAGTTTISSTLSGKTSSASLTVSNPVAREVFCGGKNATATLPKCDPASPTSNTVFVTTMPDTSAYLVVQVNSGGDLQTAINKASCNPTGTIISVAAGATFNAGFGSGTWGAGPYQLPSKTCAPGQWIIIQSSAIASLPASGTRVAPTDAVNMPKIQSVGGLPAIVITQNANHYRFIGVEVSPPVATDTTNLIDLDAADNGFPSTVGTDFIFDRCYVHGNADGAAHNYRRGFSAQTRRFALLDSYVNQFHDNGSDSQTLNSWASTGPFKIINNYLSASGENIMFGGVPANVTAQDVEIRHNHFFKPTVWKGTAIVTKNLFELKNAQRVLLDGNVFENTWLSAQQFALVWTTSAGDSGPNAAVTDITFTHNIVRHAPNGMQIATNGGGTAPRRMLFQNNLFDDINSATWGDGTNGWYAEEDVSGNTIVHDHNTIFEAGPTLSLIYGFYSSGFPGTISGWQFTNNVINHGSSGVRDLDRGLAEGLPTLNSYVPREIWNKNVIIYSSNLSSTYPSGTFFAVPDHRAVKFSNFAGGDYHLQSSSPYHNAGTDGKDIGADIDSINSATAGVIQVHD